MTLPASDGEVPAFWRGLGLPGLADIHVHFLPPRMLRRVWAYFDEAGPLVGISWPIIYKWSDAERVEHLRAMGVRVFTALAYAHRPDMAADLNAWTLDFARQTPDCLPCATFYPEPGVADYTRAALDRGARVFKVHLQVGGFDPADPLLDAVWGVLAEAGVPVVVHAGSGPVANVHTGPEPFAAVLRRHPRLLAVIAHLGAPEYTQFLALAETHERVYLDTTMAFTRFFEAMAPFPQAELARLRELGLAGRVLLGSDFPNLPYPYAEQLAALAALDLGEPWLRAVCWHNAASLLGLA
ncbi:MAG: amidohydrolase family protein [Micromonosporaceae bacterium]